MSTNASPRRTAGALLEYVTMPNCRDCRNFEALLARVVDDYPGIEARAVAADSARGRQASLERGVLRFPVILLDDEIIAVERIAEADLRRFLDRAGQA